MTENLGYVYCDPKLIFLSTGLCANAQSAFDRKIAEALKIMKCAEPSDERPVTLNAGLLHDKDSTAVILKVQMAPGWHIYQYVPASMPYISIDQILKLPEGISDGYSGRVVLSDL